MTSTRRSTLRRLAAPALALAACAALAGPAAAEDKTPRVNLNTDLEGPAVVTVNAEGVWHATVTNYGNQVIDVSDITLRVPDLKGLVLLPDADSPKVLHPGESLRYTLRHRVGPEYCGTKGALYMTVVAELATGEDREPADDAKTFRSDVAACTTDLAIAKRATRASHLPGETITWDVTVTNQGHTPVDVDEVLVSDATAGLEAVSLPDDGWLDPGETMAMRGTTATSDADCGVVTNTATVALSKDSSLWDPRSDNDQATAETLVEGGACAPPVPPAPKATVVAPPPPAVVTGAPRCPVPNLAVRLSGGSATAGGRTTALVQVRNHSRAHAARDMILRYRLPAGASLASLPSGARMSGGVLVHRIGALAPGRGRDVRIALRYAKDAVGRARQQATVTAACGAGKAASAVVRVRALPVQLQPAVTG